MLTDIIGLGLEVKLFTEWQSFVWSCVSDSAPSHCMHTCHIDWPRLGCSQLLGTRNRAPKSIWEKLPYPPVGCSGTGRPGHRLCGHVPIFSTSPSIHSLQPMLISLCSGFSLLLYLLVSLSFFPCWI